MDDSKDGGDSPRCGCAMGEIGSVYRRALISSEFLQIPTL